LRNEEDIVSYTNLKKAAMGIWNSFMEVGSKQGNTNNVYLPGPFFVESV
jgi:hypothetical protein